METTDTNKNIINGYYDLIKNLSPDSKLELIARLSDSMKSPITGKNGSWKHLYGAFISEKSAEELVDDIRRARTFSRNTESL